MRVKRWYWDGCDLDCHRKKRIYAGIFDEGGFV
jgi:hypothetical protein